MLTLNEKNRLIIVEQSGKSVKYIFIGLKKTCLGVLERAERGNDSETGLKEGEVTKIETTVASITRCSLLRLNTYLDQYLYHCLLEVFELLCVYLLLNALF